MFVYYVQQQIILLLRVYVLWGHDLSLLLECASLCSNATNINTNYVENERDFYMILINFLLFKKNKILFNF